MKLFYRTFGHQGPSLIIMHGLYGSSDNWIPIAKELEGDFRVILPDMRNHGKSQWSEIHTYESISEDILELMETLALEKAFIAGHSMGGKAAALFAFNHPEKLSGLFLGDISPFSYKEGGATDSLHREIINIMSTTDLSRFKSRKEAEDYLSSLAGEKTTKLVFSKNIRTEKGILAWKINAKALFDNMDKFLEGIPRPVDGKAKVNGFPVIVLKGDRSTYIEEKDIEDILTVFPRAEIRIAENSGHWIHTNRPDAVVQALKDLLGSAGIKGCC